MYYSDFMRVQYKIILNYNSMDIEYSSSIGLTDSVFTLSLKEPFYCVVILQSHVTHIEQNTINESCRMEYIPLYIIYSYLN